MAGRTGAKLFIIFYTNYFIGDNIIMIQFAIQHPIATVFIVWIVCETITVAVKDICSVFSKKTK